MVDRDSKNDGYLQRSKSQHGSRGGKGDDADDHVSATRTLMVIVVGVVVVTVGMAIDAIWWVSESRVENRADRKRKTTTSTGRTWEGNKISEM